ncbi:unnamed protein product [Notodromas monacha]|uniref:Zinc finger protein ush n=1 Tax=Notodromas monacha TaxID=399045 RepID=A0A7R9BQI7_9CRUS|nr:unnamed protein product [Notodromas monacha]CAG0918737.1 unnamed protein product [Notodromas monacha]
MHVIEPIPRRRLAPVPFICRSSSPADHLERGVSPDFHTLPDVWTYVEFSPTPISLLPHHVFQQGAICGALEHNPERPQAWNPGTSKGFVCQPCGIRFSSPGTLEAHQTYYCSARIEDGETPATIREVNKCLATTTTTNSNKRQRMHHHSSTIHNKAPLPRPDGSANASPDSDTTAPPVVISPPPPPLPSALTSSRRAAANQILTTTRLRLGSSSNSKGSTITKAPPPPPPHADLMLDGVTSTLVPQPPQSQVQLPLPLLPGLVLSESLAVLHHHQQQQHHQQQVVTAGHRTNNNSNSCGSNNSYCRDCGIQFSSASTYQVHRKHYCQGGGGGVHQLEDEVVPGGGGAGFHPATATLLAAAAAAASDASLCVVLPTNPLLVIPYQVLQCARYIPVGVVPPGSITVGPDGTLTTTTANNSSTTMSNNSSRVRKRPATIIRASGGSGDHSIDDEVVEPSAAELEENKAPFSHHHHHHNRETHQQPARRMVMVVKQDGGVVEECGDGAAGPLDLSKPLAHGSSLPQPQPSSQLTGESPSSADDTVVSLITTTDSTHTDSGTASLRSYVTKKGVSKCSACNIVFYKRENYLVHKEHYCASRGGGESSITADVGGAAGGGKQVVLQQQQTCGMYTCGACGTRFSSPKNLRAHQSYYCSNKLQQQQQHHHHHLLLVPSSSAPLVRNGNHKHGSPSPTGSGTTVEGTAGAGAGLQRLWRCPCCAFVTTSVPVAQCHLEGHGGLQAFTCRLCGYKGNTLRGMRNHIRMHFADNKSKQQDVSEETIIAHILAGPDEEEEEEEEDQDQKEDHHNCVSNMNDCQLNPDDAYGDDDDDDDDQESFQSSSSIPFRIIKEKDKEEKDHHQKRLMMLLLRQRQQLRHKASPVHNEEEVEEEEEEGSSQDQLLFHTKKHRSNKTLRMCKNCHVPLPHLSALVEHKKSGCVTITTTGSNSSSPSSSSELDNKE